MPAREDGLWKIHPVRVLMRVSRPAAVPMRRARQPLTRGEERWPGGTCGAARYKDVPNPSSTNPERRNLDPVDAVVLRAMAKWPNVPAVFGWLSLDRRGRWLLRGEPIGNAAARQFISRNYQSDPHGRWFFQNGPQRVFVEPVFAGGHLRRAG